MKKILSLFSLCLILYACSSDGGGDDIVTDPCGVPTQISTTNIAAESVAVTWTSSESNASYQIEYGTSGFSQGNGQTLTASGGSTSITGLTPATTYQFYIRANCGNSDFSDWIGPFSFTTAQIDCTEATDLFASTTENAAFTSWSNSNNNDDPDSWIIEYGPTGFSPGSGTQATTSIQSYSITNLTHSTTYDFYVTADCGNNNLGDLVGPYTFTTDPLCFAPDGVYLDTGSVSFCSFNFGWQTNNETSFEVEYGLSGFTLGTGTIINTSDNYITVDNLFPGLTYEVYVRANCGSDGYSEYSDALVATTNEEIYGTWTIDMTDSFGDGWQTNDGNGGDGITVTITNADNTETVFEIGMCSPYGGSAVGTFLGGTDCTGPASLSFFNASTTIDIPTGITNMVWNFPGDQYGEIGFSIYNPNGDLVYSVATGQQAAGEIAVDYCN